MRVVSVLPSATEIVHGLGAGGDLVGRSQECDYPSEVSALPIVMRAKTLDSDAPSGAIDARVKASIAAGESLYELDLPALARLRPDLILTQDLCRVCSVTDEEVVGACHAAGIDPAILSLSPTRLFEVWDSVERIGQALGRAEEGRRLADRLRALTPEPVGPGESRIAVVEWLDPPIVSGLWTPEIIRSAGGLPWSAKPGGPAQTISWESLRRDPPAAVVVSPCSFSVSRTKRELVASALGRTLRELHAPLGVWLADEACFSRPGPRLVEGRALLRQILDGCEPRVGLEVERWSAPAREVAS
jgi:iron complex transport system substrate-binding protein